MTRGVKTVLTEEQRKAIEEYAFEGCSNHDISAMIGVPVETLRDSKVIRPILDKKRAERRRWLRQAQNKHTLTTPVMSIFLGKNELGQTDKQEVKHGVDEAAASLLNMIDGASRGLLPSEE